MLGKRADGYHDLDTILQTVSLHDTLEISLIDEPHLIMSGDDRSLPTDQHNLVMRAARCLQTHSGTSKGARIRLQKRIPSPAGLGGGSSDAAVTLMGLCRLWQLNVKEEELLRIAAQLGSDVPFFLHGGRARAQGRGELITPGKDAPETFLLILKPNANLSTADAYRVLDERSLTSPNSKIILSTSEATEAFENSFANLTNDFEAVALDLEPEIRRAKNALSRADAAATLLAGSGSAVFGIFDSEDAQRRAIQAIELETGWRVFPCKTVGRDKYRRALNLS